MTYANCFFFIFHSLVCFLFHVTRQINVIWTLTREIKGWPERVAKEPYGMHVPKFTTKQIGGTWISNEHLSSLCCPPKKKTKWKCVSSELFSCSGWVLDPQWTISSYYNGEKLGDIHSKWAVLFALRNL